MEGSQEWGVGFIMGDGKFLKSIYIVGRGVLTPLFYEDPPVYIYTTCYMLTEANSLH